ncbi:Dienelactone hydrolase [Parasponia andersonii]|uniref:Dienelactone hydrolase n=1 Tax=Parasponia andersonii TaxID=3476 RepID=A0A2P5B6A3_PARAD|nr:Dienelactone hydrolase [Parasponia andersonii]
MAGPQCCSNPPNLNPSSGEGTVDQLGGLKAYISGTPHPKLAILLVTDGFGYKAPNLRKLADKVAAAGFYVVAPDFFYGEPFDWNRPLQDWLKDHETDKGFEDAKLVVEALRSKGFSAVGAAGFCWGGKVAIELAKCNLIQAAVLCHPSFVTLDDVKGVKVPISILAAEIDQLTPPAIAKRSEEVLTAKSEVDSYVEVFPKVVHGWTLRYEVDDEAAANAAEDAHKKMLDWFSKYVK